MNARVDHLLEEVLGLPTDERSAVATALIDSLEGSEDATIAEAWRLELRRRRDELRAGHAQPASWADARARMTSL